MAQTPTSPSALINNAAKDDVVGLNGDFNFTISDLLANDPGGAAKVNIGTQFFFGDSAPAAGIPSIGDQVSYLAAHGITAHLNAAGTAFVSFDIGESATDINYFVQIGNKGTWSQAHVDVSAPDPVVVPHLGGNLFTENFDNIPAEHVWVASGSVWQQVDLNAAHGWTGAAYSELGADGYLEVETTSGATGQAFWLDTQNSPGPINISHDFIDGTAPVDGKTAVLSFDIAKQDFDGHFTPANESFEFRIDGQTVAQIDASDLTNAGQMYHYEVNIAGYADNTDSTHTLSLVDTTGEFHFNGFSVDSVQINDWVV
ncbi:hypothetical protein QO002_006291 [Pararhizobium capsulatum DSM 1112]|uniref:Uncharacterized protein n=1 Tax=Pararhizobium capsulatum DSM 1112 TaxID=1121113 RepID=A0ABU0C2A1_9HYPH|nr:hypothetical protein [Pararhizobium capsulatum]MDQ0324084.1 hypothetical protein [Pararhizobium capsulatum DSM 1112]